MPKGHRVRWRVEAVGEEVKKITPPHTHLRALGWSFLAVRAVAPKAPSGPS